VTTEQTKQVTTFMDQGSEQITVMPNLMTHPSKPILLDSTMEDRRHQIHDFLSRPVFLGNITWNTTSPPGTILQTYRFPDVLLAYAGNVAKTRGFYGFRAGVEFMVKVNRQPFQGGLLMISYNPNARYNTSKTAQHALSIRTRSCAPRALINLKQDTEATLIVPYFSVCLL